MGGGRSTYWGEERCIQEFSWEDLKEGNDFQDPVVDGRKIKMDLQEVGCGA
jgi:hypothetical protein